MVIMWHFVGLTKKKEEMMEEKKTTETIDTECTKYN